MCSDGFQQCGVQGALGIAISSVLRFHLGLGMFSGALGLSKIPQQGANGLDLGLDLPPALGSVRCSSRASCGLDFFW